MSGLMMQSCSCVVHLCALDLAFDFRHSDFIVDYIISRKALLNVSSSINFEGLKSNAFAYDFRPSTL